MKKKIMVLYHAGCPDGFGAAWAFWRKYRNEALYIPVSYGKEPPDVTGMEVYMVDFCYEKEAMLTLKEKAKSLIVLDHHKTGLEHCGDLDFCHFDMNHSGAYIAWAYLFGDKDVPNIVKFVEDRDLWAWKITDSEPMLLAIDSYERTFENWDRLNSYLWQTGTKQWNKILHMGEGILQYNNNLQDLIMKNSYRIDIMGYNVPAVNTPFFQSEIVNKLSVGQPFAAGYYWDGDVYRFSLRSKDAGGEDVSKIAEKFIGGGGHKRAAGFSIKNLSELKGEAQT